MQFITSYMYCWPIFGRNLPDWTDDVKSAANKTLQIIEQSTEIWGRVFEVGGNGGTSIIGGWNNNQSEGVKWQLLMSRTKTNRWPHRKQYTRSNAATAMSITLVELAETLVCMYANERQKNNVDINNHIAEHHFKTKHQIDWDPVKYRWLSTTHIRKLVNINVEQTRQNLF